MRSFLFTLATLAVVQAASLFNPKSSGDEGLEKRLDLFTNGFPGMVCKPDAYNVLATDWNRTYTPSEPQQLILSWGEDSKYATVQFATLGQVDHTLLKYWTKGNTDNVIIKGQDRIFTDGGIAKRKLYLHNFKTNPLTPATVYAYQVGAATSADDSQVQWSSVYEFHTASTTDEFSFLSVGDIGACNAVSAAHLKNAGKTHEYDFISIAGDQAYNMDDFGGTKGDQYLNFMQDLFAQVPYLGSVGNHESAYNFSHYKNRFDLVPHIESNNANSMFYSINYKSLHLVSFSTEVFFSGSDEEVQYAINWLNADLTKANANRAQRPWIIFLTHHPIYCSSIGISLDCTTKASKIRKNLEDLLLKHKVDIYVSGHVHNYERTYPVYQDKKTASTYNNPPNLFQMVVGNGGQPEGVAKFSAWLGRYADWSAVRFENYGYTSFKVSPTKIDIVHRATLKDGNLGDIVDQFSVTKDVIQ